LPGDEPTLLCELTIVGEPSATKRRESPLETAGALREEKIVRGGWIFRIGRRGQTAKKE